MLLNIRKNVGFYEQKFNVDDNQKRVNKPMKILVPPFWNFPKKKNQIAEKYI